MLLALILAVLVGLHAISLRYHRPKEVSLENRRDSTVNRLYGRASSSEAKVVFTVYALFALTTVWIERGDLAKGLDLFLTGVWGLGAIMLAGTVLMGLLKGRLYKFSLIGLAWRIGGLYVLYSTSDILNDSYLTVMLLAAGWEALYRIFSAYTKWAAWSIAKENEAKAKIAEDAKA